MKAKTLFIISLLLIFVASCNSEKENNFIENIIGDWKSVNVEERISFSFEESVCAFRSSTPKAFYKIISDSTLILNDSVTNKWDEWNYKYTFTINYLSKDSLVLTPIEKDTRNLFYHLKDTSKSFSLKKIVKKNDFKFERIGLYSSMCFGTCPSMFLEIDSFGNFLFDGGYGTNSSGFYLGELSLKQLNLIDKKINQIDLNKLKSDYDARYTDAQTICLKVLFPKDSIETKVYGYSSEPIELRMLFHYLMELYKEVELKPEEYEFQVLDNIKFRDLLMKRHPLPPPPDYED